jgi:hypothetical protein
MAVVNKGRAVKSSVSTSVTSPNAKASMGSVSKQDAPVVTTIENKLQEATLERAKKEFSEPTKKTGSRPTKYNPKAKYRVLVKEPTLRKGTNRYRNMQVIMEWRYIGDALRELKRLDPSPGSAMDITIAIKTKAIELLDKED